MEDERPLLAQEMGRQVGFGLRIVGILFLLVPAGNLLFVGLAGLGLLELVLPNAIEAIDERGRIEIETGSSERSVFVRVQDNGRGIKKADLPHVTSPGFTTKGRGVGTGLGLSITYRIVEAQGGTLTVQSTKGEGSCFIVHLPLEEVPDETIAIDRRTLGAAADPVLPEGVAVNALIVDDNAENRDILTKLLRGIGFEADAVNEGAAALAAMREKTYGLVLMDLRMPGMNGVEATKRIRADDDLCGTVILAVTASVFPEFRQQARDVGFDDFIPKPLHVAELLGKIELHLGITFADRAGGEEATETAAQETVEETLDPAVLARLSEAVRMRNLTALGTIAAEIEAAGSPALAAQITTLTRGFDFKGLGEIIDGLEA